MDGEESSDDDGFRKRKKLDGADAGADGEDLIANLLQNNKFGPLAGDNNNNENTGQGGEGSVPVVPAPSKATGKQKQPPLVVMNMSCYQLQKVLSASKADPDYRLTRSGIKMTCFSVKEYDTVRALLQKHKVQFYTHERKQQRAHRVVLRGLPDGNVEFLKIRLKEDYNLDALEVKAIKRKGDSTTDETPFIVSFPKGHTNLKKLEAVKKIMGFIIRWEAYRNKRPYVTQCRNCLRLGHGAKNCHLQGRCNNCGKSHKTDQCKAEESQAKRCANCSGAHEAMDRNCPKRADFIQARQQPTQPKAPARKAEKGKPVPVLNLDEFPPLPGAVPVEPSPQPGGNKGGTGSSSGGITKDKAVAGSSQDSAGSRADATSKAEGEEVLYNPAELWGIFTEFSARLKNSRTRSDQVAVLGYMICKYGSK